MHFFASRYDANYFIRVKVLIPIKHVFSIKIIIIDAEALHSQYMKTLLVIRIEKATEFYQSSNSKVTSFEGYFNHTYISINVLSYRIL